MPDTLSDGRRIRALTLVNNSTREALAIVVDGGMRGELVVRAVEQAAAGRGTPRLIRVDNGPGFVSRMLDCWAYERGVTLDFPRPGKPTDNCLLQGFNGRLRDEWLNIDWFLSVEDAQARNEAQRRDYNLLRRKLTRRKLIELTATLKSTLVGMEACGGARFLARLLREQGHDARIIPAQFVKPFVKSQKNDFLDAEAIAEAVQRPTMRFVPIKTEEQLDMQTLHRVRDRLVGCRTALINQVRAVLLERGLTFPKGRASTVHVVAELVTTDTGEVAVATRELLALLWQEWQDLQVRVDSLTFRIEQAAAQDEVCRKLTAVPGIGPLTATALVSAVADGSMFRRARDLSAWLGLVPQQRSTGGRAKLLSISKRGNSYLWRLLVVGAQSVWMYLNRERHARLGGLLPQAS